jgi:YidC/Oxa1 family membrane protein insertase
MTTLFAIMPKALVDGAFEFLRWFHDAGLSWGLSIIALTVVVRMVILPLTFKQVRAMQDMQRHAPELKKLQERYKEDRQRLNEETMKYYKEHSFNPLSSCLPLLLQIPVFITLFEVLRDDGPFHAAVGENEPFLFIPSLTAPAGGVVLVVLIALYIGTQLGASLVSMVNAEGTQKRIMLALPFVFAPIIISFPAGLVVYWITTNLWTVLQQLAVKKVLPMPAKPETDVSESEGKPAGRKAAANGRSADGATAKSGSENGARAARSKAGVGANGANGGPRKPPPPSPRKKKKRSGRRR